MTDLRVTLTDNGFEFEEVETVLPEPGERCPTCDRRVPKPRKVSSPASKRIVATLPAERAEAIDDALELRIVSPQHRRRRRLLGP